MHSEQTAPASERDLATIDRPHPALVPTIPDATGTSSLSAVPDPGNCTHRAKLEHLAGNTFCGTCHEWLHAGMPTEAEVAALEPVDDDDEEPFPFPGAQMADIPGVGPTPIGVQGRPYVAGQVSDNLRAFVDQDSSSPNERRNELLSELIFVSRRLVGRSVATIQLPRREDRPGVLYRCLVCKAATLDLEPIEHTRRCEVGRIDRCLDQLATLLPSGPQSGGETDAVPPQTEAAGDSSAPAASVVSERFCKACGAIDAAWITERKFRTDGDLKDVGLNQCVSLESVDGYHTLHTHLCSETFVQEATA